MITSASKKGRVGVMIVGHKEYWSQFKNCRAGHLRNGEALEKLIGSNDVELVKYTNSSGDQMIDSTEIGNEAGEYFRSQCCDLLVVLVPVYVASGRYMNGLIRVGCPVVLVSFGVQHDFGIVSLEEGMGVFGGFTSLMETVQAMRRCGVEPAGVIAGQMQYDTLIFDKRFSEQISQWCRVASCLRSLRGAIFGSLGHTYEGMLDMNFDPTTFTRSYGIHIRFLEMCELVQCVNEATEKEVKTKIEEMRDIFEFTDKSYDTTTRDISDDDVEWAARCAAGLDKFVINNNLNGMAYYYEGLDNNIYERVASNLIIGNSLLTSKGISLAGEHDMKTCVAMYIMSSLGCGGSFSELGGLDFDKNEFSVGHDGPHDYRIAEGKPKIRGLGVYHGKKGHGISVEFPLKYGPMTMVGTGCDYNNQYKFIVCEVESVPGSISKMGNSMTRGKVNGNVSEFLERWALANNSHHQALSIGHNFELLEKLGKCLGIPVEKVEC